MTRGPAATPMDADRWRLVNRILTEALELPATERAAFLEKACLGDSALRSEVDSLIEAAQQSAFLDNPAMAASTVTEPGGRAAIGHVALIAGKQFGPYRILRKLGEGGMGVVYRATDSRLGRPVALKLLSSIDTTEYQRTRFAREARAASALNHPNIATIYEFDKLNGTDFIAMEYVEGVTLQNVLEEKKTPQSQLLEYARQTARAASAAHAAGIVHRDLKPANIMIKRDGTVKVLDFGLAKIESQPTGDVDATRTMALTQAGAVVGTPAYMSPEQVAGEAVDHRTDIFALGIMLYEMVCGERPFRGPNAHSTLHLIATTEARPVVEFNSAAPARLVSLIDRCLKKKKEERLQSMGDVAVELAEILAPTEGTPPLLRRPLLRRKLLFGLAAVSIAIAGGYWFLRPPAVHNVTCWIEVRDKEGQAHAASFRDTFDSGTRFRLGAEAMQSGYLYIVGGEADGKSPVSILYGGSLQATQRAQTEWLVIEGPPGSDRVSFVWSGRAVDALEPGMLTKLQGASPGTDGGIELRGTAEVIGAQVEIRHR